MLSDIDVRDTGRAVSTDLLCSFDNSLSVNRLVFRIWRNQSTTTFAHSPKESSRLVKLPIIDFAIIRIMILMSYAIIDSNTHLRLGP